METTKAIVIESFGGPEVLRLQELPLHDPGPGEVLLRIEAAGVNPADLGMRDGRYPWAEPPRFPLVPGYDVAGVVESVGREVIGLAVGDPVTATTAHAHSQIGSYAERVVLPADRVVPAPGLTVEARACLPLAGTVALQALRRLGLNRDQVLLINGVSGAVGCFLAQLAHRAGSIVLGTASTDDHDYLRSLSVDPLDRHRPLVDQLHDRGIDTVDAAFDAVGGPSAGAAFATVRDNGRYATIVPDFWIPGGQFTPARGITPEVVVYSPIRADLAELVDLVSAGALHARIADTLPLAAAPEAHSRLMKGGLRGKLLLRP
ncbi:NADP-dependent oxidoreductase [Nocardia sp. NEAU-G5]|uniref:NADP-dependent oxidoreductase n=1 Tax=Nocardia albiluteola TaxID=2842303 RepID=A0ABS6BCA8_9NOCA|nr:NADP-dependent oxidoreductase [Nocardia albiluteola]MBU3067045.1 NADP-dependent oxidoreductase [Nocardia albiluteola]